MTVYIINQELNHKKRYQIMTQSKGAFYHVFPGQLFDLGTAIETCGKNGWTIKKIGNIYKCMED